MNLTQGMLCACVGLAAACGPTKFDQQQSAVPVTPTGSVVGRITDVITGAPIEGVTVTVVTPTKLTATTDATGQYTVNNVVVASAFTMYFEKTDYLRSIVSSVAVPGQVGGGASAPLNGGFSTVNVQMAKPNGTILGVLVLPDQTPAIGATVSVDLRGNGFDSVVTATTDMKGAFKLTGLATATSGVFYDVFAQYFDANGDGVPEFGATDYGVNVYPGTPARIFMQYDDTGQTVIASNILEGSLGANQDITLSFSLPINPAGHQGNTADQFIIYDSRTGNALAVTPTWSSPTDVKLAINGTLEEGVTYTLAINNVQTIGSGTFSNSYQFQVRGATAVGPNAPVTKLTVHNQSDTTFFDFGDDTFLVGFEPVPGISGYWLYAKDDKANQSYTRVATFDTGGRLGRFQQNISVPFNSYQPLGNGATLTFAVVPVDAYGNSGDVAASPTVKVKDNTSPTTSTNGAAAVGAIDAINDTSAATTLSLRFDYSEPMDQAVSPVLTSSAGATVAQIVTWASSTRAVITLTVPANTDLSGTFVVRGGKDLAGNALSGPEYTGFLGGRKELLVNGGFEDATGACSLAGWTQTQGGGMPVSVATPGAGLPSSGKCAALIGAPLGTTPQVGISKLSQDIGLPDISMSPAWRFEVTYADRPEFFNPSGTAVAVSQRCQITSTADVLIQNLFSWSSSTRSSYSGPSVTNFTPATNGQTVRLMCTVDNSVALAPAVNAALYLDGLSLALVKNTSFNN